MRSSIRGLWVLVMVAAAFSSSGTGVAVADKTRRTLLLSTTVTTATTTVSGPQQVITSPPTAEPVKVQSSGPLAVSISPTSGPVGTVITVRGAGWTHQVYVDGVEVEISQNFGNGQLTRLTSEGRHGEARGA
jgi:hypothetical protein